MLYVTTEFEVLFAVVKKSQYRKECSTRITTQLNALSCDDYWKAEDYVHQSGHQPSIFPDNPCHAGYAFAGLNIEGKCNSQGMQTFVVYSLQLIMYLLHSLVCPELQHNMIIVGAQLCNVILS